MRKYYLISVDIETSGPTPRDYDMLSIGACAIIDVSQQFYVEIKPENLTGQSEALAVSGLSLDTLSKTATEPSDAMRMFEEWVLEITPSGEIPLFVAFNAPFDWMFVADAFDRYLGRNPFGYSALDIKAVYMGLFNTSWAETSYLELTKRFNITKPLSHNALEDAIDQANIYNLLIAEKEMS